MINGTRVNEIIDSLNNGDLIIQMIGDGWRPRKNELRFIDINGSSIKLSDKQDIIALRDLLNSFFSAEDKIEK